jgi:regulator of protease activity HflC (stomatin/prohibitin superfamily)
MDSALAWVGQIANWIGRFIPRLLIVKATHGGVKFVRGWKVVEIKAGLHVWWPLTTEVQLYPVVRQADDLRSQTLTTSDRVALAASALIVFDVPDVKTLLTQTFDPDGTVQEIALAAILDVLPAMSWPEIHEMPRRKLNTLLRRSASAMLKPYGVRVIEMTLVDLSPCRVIRLLGDGQPQIQQIQQI